MTLARQVSKVLFSHPDFLKGIKTMIFSFQLVI